MFAERAVKISKLPAFRAEHFPYAGPYPWLDRPDALERIEAKLHAQEITPDQAQQCRRWVSDGYIIIEKLFDRETLNVVWGAYQRAVDAGKIRLKADPAGEGDPYPGRYLNPHKKTGSFCRILKHAGLLNWIRLLMEREPKALQTIAAHKGSEQAVHSDSIHMTTYPLGYLSAAWIAFEDIHPDSGPLAFYPGSHRFPYVFSKDVGISVTDFKRDGYRSYVQKYEPHIQKLLAETRAQPKYFHACAGDVLIWHANLLHGGSKRQNLQLSRKSVVCHFFVKDAFVYHDLAAARSRQQYMGTCLMRDDSGEIRGLGLLRKKAKNLQACGEQKNQ
jgi:hypothetical protein